MSSLDAMFKASPVYFQYVNKRATHVKTDCVSRQLISNLNCCRMAFDYWGFMNEKQKALGV